MTVAYIDTSCLVAIAFDEPAAKTLRRQLARYDRLISSNLLEAELRSALRREKVESSPDDLLSVVTWLLPHRPLTSEISRVLERGYVRGAGLWHLACALYVFPDPGESRFLTLDKAQRNVARDLGFRVD